MLFQRLHFLPTCLFDPSLFPIIIIRDGFTKGVGTQVRAMELVSWEPSELSHDLLVI
jgi:hypothetical protein